MELYTVDETARLLRVSPITIRRYIAAGQLEAVRVGRGVRVRQEAIERFVEPLRGPAPRSFRKPTGKADSSVDSLTTKQGFPSSGYLTEKDDEPLPTILESLGFSVGIGRSAEPTNIAEHKDEYLADAFETKE